MNTRTEIGEQQAVIEWCMLNENHHPELKLIYHITNEGKRSHIGGAELRKAGLKSGVPDLCLPVPKGRYSALYIEMKKDKNATVSQNQIKWLSSLSAVGNLAVICYSADEAITTIKNYLSLGKSKV